MRDNLIAIGEIKKAVLVLRALNHPLRQHIIYLLQKNGKMTVTEIYVKLRIDQTIASGQLRILRENGIVAVERAAKERYYYIVHERLEEINYHAKCLAKCNTTN